MHLDAARAPCERACRCVFIWYVPCSNHLRACPPGLPPHRPAPVARPAGRAGNPVAVPGPRRVCQLRRLHRRPGCAPPALRRGRWHGQAGPARDALRPQTSAVAYLPACGARAPRQRRPCCLSCAIRAALRLHRALVGRCQRRRRARPDRRMRPPGCGTRSPGACWPCWSCPRSPRPPRPWRASPAAWARAQPSPVTALPGQAALPAGAVQRAALPQGMPRRPARASLARRGRKRRARLAGRVRAAVPPSPAPPARRPRLTAAARMRAGALHQLAARLLAVSMRQAWQGARLAEARAAAAARRSPRTASRTRRGTARCSWRSCRQPCCASRPRATGARRRLLSVPRPSWSPHEQPASSAAAPLQRQWRLRPAPAPVSRQAGLQPSANEQRSRPRRARRVKPRGALLGCRVSRHRRAHRFSRGSRDADA